MKKKNFKKTAISFLLLASYFSYGQTFKTYLDIPNVDGEYVTPARNAKTLNGPKANNILLNKFSFAEGSTTSYGSNTIFFGRPGTIKQITVKFRIDKATPKIYDLFFNHTIIPYLNIYKDVVASPQREVERYKLSDVIISSILIESNENQIPTASVTFTYDKILRATIFQTAMGSLDLLTYCYDFSANVTCNDVF
ncbi:MAG: type VI secretion system tube protein Hcp [Bacteroidota bacterium]